MNQPEIDAALTEVINAANATADQVFKPSGRKLTVARIEFEITDGGRPPVAAHSSRQVETLIHLPGFGAWKRTGPKNERLS